MVNKKRTFFYVLLTPVQRHSVYNNTTRDPFNRTVIKVKAGGSEQDGENTTVSWLEKQLLKSAVSPLAQKIGYKW